MGNGSLRRDPGIGSPQKKLARNYNSCPLNKIQIFFKKNTNFLCSILFSDTNYNAEIEPERTEPAEFETSQCELTDSKRGRGRARKSEPKSNAKKSKKKGGSSDRSRSRSRSKSQSIGGSRKKFNFLQSNIKKVD